MIGGGAYLPAGNPIGSLHHQIVAHHLGFGTHRSQILRDQP
jgi:hypothetical protein